VENGGRGDVGGGSDVVYALQWSSFLSVHKSLLVGSINSSTILFVKRVIFVKDWEQCII
jgi:hypothetical protein